MLREFREKNKQAFISMLTYGFTVAGTPEKEATKKAELIDNLFNIKDLFIKEYKDHPIVKKITDAIYWAMVPQKDKVSSLTTLVKELEKALYPSETKNIDIAYDITSIQRLLTNIKNKEEQKLEGLDSKKPQNKI